MIRERIFLLCLSFLLLAGCSNTEMTEEEKQQTNVLAESEDAPVPSAQSGGKISLSMRIPKTLNPLINDDVTVDRALKLIFEPLFYIDANERVAPNIAQSYSLSSDGLTLTVNIRSDAKWQDGESITAEDVVFSLDTIRANPTGIYNRTLTNLQSYSAQGSSSVVINYSDSYGACMYNLCFPIIPKHYYEGKNTLNSDVSLNPLGSGLYKIEKYELVKKLTLSKNTNFRGTPYIDNVEFIISDSYETDLYSFEQNLTDVLTVDVSQWGKFNNKRGAKTTRVNSNSFEFVGYNFKNPLFQNINIRKAIACAVPSEEISENIYLSNAVRSLVPVNPLSWLSCADEITFYDYSLQNAQSFIQNSGYTKEELTFEMIVNDENNERCESAELIANCLNQAGMNVTVKKLPFDEYKKALDDDNFDMFTGGIKFGTTPDLRCLLASSSTSDGGVNYTNFSDANMDLLLGQACIAVGEDEYKKYMDQIQKYCADQLPFVGILFKSSIVLTDDDIYGYGGATVSNDLNGIQNWYIVQQ